MLMSSQKIRPSIYMAVCMIAWAIVSACTALVTDYKGLVIVRFLLGVTEAPFCKFPELKASRQNEGECKNQANK